MNNTIMNKNAMEINSFLLCAFKIYILTFTKDLCDAMLPYDDCSLWHLIQQQTNISLFLFLLLPSLFSSSPLLFDVEQTSRLIIIYNLLFGNLPCALLAASRPAIQPKRTPYAMVAPDAG